MRIHRLALFLLGVAALLAAPTTAQARPGGSIQGRVNPASALRSGRLLFLLDGAQVTPRINRAGFVVRGVRPGNHSLTVFDPEGTAGAVAQVEVRRGAMARAGTLTLISGGQIAGLVSKVVGPGELEPLPGVEVVAESEWVLPHPETGTIVPGEEIGGGGGGIPPGPPGKPVRVTTVTDAGGAYSLRNVPPGGYRVSVVVPGLEAGVGFAWVEAGSTAAVDFQLRESIEEGVGTVTGAVTSPDGTPLEGALVTVLPDDLYIPPVVSPESAAGAERLGLARRAMPDVLPRLEFSTLTDQNGRYSLNVPSGYSTLFVSADGFDVHQGALVVHPRETLHVDVVLTPFTPPSLGAIEGRVVDAKSGKPIAGAQVRVLIFWTQMHPLPHPDLSAVTDEKGRFQIGGVPEGDWEVAASARKYEEAVLTVRVPPDGKGSLEFRLRPVGRPNR